jgi:uncharacterized membrane protein
MDNIIAANAKRTSVLDHKHDAEQTRLEKLTDVAADWTGSVPFIIWHLVIFGGWIIVNSVKSIAFDPFPYTLLTMIVSLESILLSSILLINQNKISKQQDDRHKLDLQLNMLAEQENTMMMRVMNRIANKLDVKSSELANYLEDTRPEEVLEEIEKADKGVMT